MFLVTIPKEDKKNNTCIKDENDNNFEIYCVFEKNEIIQSCAFFNHDDVNKVIDSSLYEVKDWQVSNNGRRTNFLIVNRNNMIVKYSEFLKWYFSKPNNTLLNGISIDTDDW